MATDKTYKLEPLTTARGKPLKLPGQEPVKGDDGKETEQLGKTLADVVEHIATSMDLNFRAVMTFNDLKAINHLLHACAKADGVLTIKGDDWDWLKKVIGERVPPKGAMKGEFETVQTYGGLFLGAEAPDIDELITEGFIRKTDVPV